MRLILCGALSIAAAAGAAHAQSANECRHEAQRAASVAMGDARMLELEAGAGSLRIEGKPGLTSVVIRGRACASRAELLDEIQLETRRSGNAVSVRANVRDSNRNFLRDREYARLDIVMEVPAGVHATIEDGSGSMELIDLGNVDIDDGSGEIYGENLASARIDDGSGEIRLTGIRGPVSIKDGSGGIVLRDIAGPIDINDGSGEIDIRGARSSVRISDGSGSIDVSDIDGDFIVDDDGSGSIRHHNVKGRVEIPRRKR